MEPDAVPVLKCLTLNVNMDNCTGARLDAIVALLKAEAADGLDVAALQECTPPLMERLRGDREIMASFPHSAVDPLSLQGTWAVDSFVCLLSR